MPPLFTILLVDGDTPRRNALRTLLERDGERVVAASAAEQVVDLLDGDRVAVLIAPIHLPALAILTAQLRERDALTQLVLFGSEPAGDALRLAVRQLGAVAWHDLADGPQRLLTAVECAHRAHGQCLELQVAERLKTELLANVSHELRTPLNVILGYVDLVREGTFGECPAEACGVLAKARGNASWLLDLVEEFLDLSQLEVGAARLRSDPMDPTPVLHELAEAFAVLVRAKPMAFVSELPQSLPAVAADPAKLRVVVQNLLANAAKFTERGEIRLTATPAGDGGVHIAVRDTGPGIAPEHQEVVFDAFQQLEAATGSRRGIGLGLALARRFARMMGGDLTLASVVGVGSTFTVTLPPACGPATRSHAA